MIKVVVVDDDFMVARIHSGYVARVPGFEVAGIAHSGAEALRTVADVRPDLVLLDIYLPDMAGLTVLRRIRAHGSPDPDVLVITAAQDLDTVRGAMHGGAMHYLIKPFAYESLRDRLEHYRSVHRTMLNTRGSGADQRDVDQLFGARTRPRPEPPKGLAGETAEMVEAILRKAALRNEDLSASECAQAAGLSRVSARKYLEHFVATGKAEVRLRHGSAGRPERRYRMYG